MVNKYNTPGFVNGKNPNKVKRVKGGPVQSFDSTEQKGTKVTINASKMGSGVKHIGPVTS
jgi:hypothetical protein